MRRLLTVLVLGLGTLLGPGCADPAHEQRVAMRRDNLERTLNLFVAEEARRPANLAYTADVARQQNEHDIQKLTSDLDALEQGIDLEFRRWQERQPEYQRRIAEELRGSPETIERTLPYALY